MIDLTLCLNLVSVGRENLIDCAERVCTPGGSMVTSEIYPPSPLRDEQQGANREQYPFHLITLVIAQLIHVAESGDRLAISLPESPEYGEQYRPLPKLESYLARGPRC